MINIGQICESMEDCERCEKEFLKYSYCCLFECGEHEFCRDCECGIYGEKLKE